MTSFIIPSFIRGELISDNLVEFGGRGGDVEFSSPDPMSIVDRLPLKNPGHMADLYDLSVGDIAAFLGEVGKRLVLSKNEYLREALENLSQVSDITRPLQEASYSYMPHM